MTTNERMPKPRLGFHVSAPLILIVLIFAGRILGAQKYSTPAPSTPPTLASIFIFPSTNGGYSGSDGVVPVGADVQFFATGFYSNSSTQDLTTSVTWASSDTSVATIGANTGVAIAVASGTTQITASLGGVTSAPTMGTVVAGTLEAIAITPAAAG